MRSTGLFLDYVRELGVIPKFFPSILLFTCFLPFSSSVITGCFSSLGTGIQWKDCWQAAAQRPSQHNNLLTFRRCNGQNSFCDQFFDFSMPQGSAHGTCALGIDLRSTGQSNVDPIQTTTWDNLERELAYLVSSCVGTHGGLGGNHTWESFVFVVTNPTQVDTDHTCMALPRSEDNLDLGQCIARRADLVTHVPTKAPPGASSATLDSDPGPSTPRPPMPTVEGAGAGYRKGGAWVLYGSGFSAKGGVYTILEGGIENFFPPGSRHRAWVYDGRIWNPWNGRLIPRGGAMVRLPDDLLPLAQVVVVWQPDIWIPTLDSTQADVDPWWVWVGGRWTPLTPALLDAAEWILHQGAWRVMAGSWFFSSIVPKESVRGTMAMSLQGSSNQGVQIRLSSTTSRTPSQNLSTTTRSPPSPTSSTASTSDQSDIMLQGIGYFDFLTADGDSPDWRATKKPKITG